MVCLEVVVLVEIVERIFQVSIASDFTSILSEIVCLFVRNQLKQSV